MDSVQFQLILFYQSGCILHSALHHFKGEYIIQQIWTIIHSYLLEFKLTFVSDASQ